MKKSIFWLGIVILIVSLLVWVITTGITQQIFMWLAFVGLIIAVAGISGKRKAQQVRAAPKRRKKL